MRRLNRFTYVQYKRISNDIRISSIGLCNNDFGHFNDDIENFNIHNGSRLNYSNNIYHVYDDFYHNVHFHYNIYQYHNIDFDNHFD